MKMRHNILRVKHFRSFRFGKIHLTILLPVIFMFSGCTFIENYFTKKEKTIEFMDALMSNHFKKCVSMMPLEMHPAINKDTMEIETSRFKAKLDSIFGSEWKINFLSVGTYKDNTIEPPESYQFCLVQLSSDTCFGQIKLSFANNTNMIDNIEFLFKKPIPDKSNFYVFSTLALLVFTFNLFTIRKVVKSQLSGKWKWILAIIFLNYPALVFSVMKGPYISWTSFITMFGKITITDIENMQIMMALPIGAILVLYKLELIKRKDIENEIIDENQEQKYSA
jgi:hypothetical protein